MAKNPEYIKWTPVDLIPERMYCEAIHDDYEGFRILLKGEDPDSPILRLSFDSVLSYRSTDEGTMLKTLDLSKDREIFPLYIVQNSSLLEWLNEESYKMYPEKEVKHYSIMTHDEIIDVLSQFDPKVEWLNK